MGEQGVKRAQVVLYRFPLLPSLWLNSLQDTDGQIVIPSTLWGSWIIASATGASQATTAVAIWRSARFDNGRRVEAVTLCIQFPALGRRPDQEES
jgi:hypothetical protein